MELSPSQKKTVTHQSDSICRKVLRDESRNYKKQMARRAEREINLSALSETEPAQLYETDEHPSDSVIFDVPEYRVAVKDDHLAEALTALPLSRACVRWRRRENGFFIPHPPLPQKRRQAHPARSMSGQTAPVDRMNGPRKRTRSCPSV